jgi:hypothetical protein
MEEVIAVRTIFDLGDFSLSPGEFDLITNIEFSHL